MPANLPQPPNPDVLDLFDDATLAEIPVADLHLPGAVSSRKVPRLPVTLSSLPKSDHFDFSDAQEIDRFRAPGTRYEAHSFEKEVSRAFEAFPSPVQSALNKDAALKRRFESILVTYLKDIRDELETRDRLSARVEQGGMGFSFDTIEEIFKSLSLPVTPIDIEKMRVSEDKPKIPQPPAPAPTPLAVESPGAPLPRPAPTGGVKLEMVDIKHPQKLVNPTQEFAMFDLADMRRSGAQQFAEEVIKRIEKLSRDEFANRRAAISAWRSSPLYRRYVVIGKGTLKSGADMRTYLSEHGDGLTYEEFEAIGRLNERLRF